MFKRFTVASSGTFSVDLSSYSEVGYKQFEIYDYESPQTDNNPSKITVNGNVNGVAPFYVTNAEWSQTSVTITFSHTGQLKPTNWNVLYKINPFYESNLPGQNQEFRWYIDQEIETIAPNNITTSFNKVTYNFSAPLPLGGKYGIWTGSNYAISDSVGQSTGILSNYIYDLPPVIIANDSVDINEKIPIDTIIYQTSAQAAYQTQVILYSLTGPDASLFAVNQNTGAIKFKNSPDFEMPKDVGKDNQYNISIIASDGILSSTENLMISLNNVVEAPSFNSDPNISISWGTNIGDIVYTPLTLTDVSRQSSTLVYAIRDGIDAASFSIDSTTGALKLKQIANAWRYDPNGNGILNVTISVSDGIDTTLQNLALTFTLPTDLSILITNDSGLTAHDNVTKSATISGTATANAPIFLQIGANTTINLVADSSGNWNYSPTNLQDGTYDFTAREVNSLGLKSSPSQVLTMVLDTSPPVANQITAGNISSRNDVTISFNEAITRGSGAIYLHKKSATGPDSLIETFDSATSDRISFSHNTVNVIPTNGLTDFSNYYVRFGSNSIRDIAGNGIVSTGNVVSFGTGTSNFAKYISGYGPAPSATGVALGSDIVFKFSIPIKLGRGSIDIKDASGKLVESLTASDYYLSNNTLVIPGNALTLDPGTAYKIFFNADAVEDANAIPFPPYSAYSFKTTVRSFKYNDQYDYYKIDYNGQADKTTYGVTSNANNASEYFLFGTDTTSALTVNLAATADFLINSNILNLDETFGKIAPFGPVIPGLGLNEKVIDGGSSTQEVHGAAIDTQGRLIVVGTISSATGNSKGFSIARFNADGSFDTNFASKYGGKLEVDLTSGVNVGWSVIIQHNPLHPNDPTEDRYLIGGTIDSNSLAIIRINNDGTVDKTFGAASLGQAHGILIPNQTIYNSADFMFEYPDSNYSNSNIIVAGTSLDSSQPVFRFYSYTANGILDSANFGNQQGAAIANNPWSPDERATVVKPYRDDGYFIVGGTAFGSDGSSRFSVVRESKNGTQDQAWGFTVNNWSVMNYYDRGTKCTLVDLAVNQDGKVTVLGYITDGSSKTKIKLERFNADGTSDSSFGTNGNLIIDTPYSVLPTKLTLTPTELLVAATLNTTANDNSKDFSVFVRDTDGHELYSVNRPVAAALSQGTGFNSKALYVTGISSDAAVYFFNGTKDITSSFTRTGVGIYAANSNAFTGSETFSLTVTIANAAGNMSAASNIVTGRIDTTAPNVPLITTSALGNNGKLTISGTAEANSTVTVYDGTSVLGTMTASSGGSWSVTPPNALTQTVHTITAKAADAAGNVSSASTAITLTVAAPDTTAPTLSSVTPADEATSVAVGANAVLTFSETVIAGSGNILIKSGTTTVQTISVTDTSQVTFSGSTVTINPSSDLGYGTAYSIVIASGVIKDSAGNAYAGTSTYNFTTGAAPDTVAPTLSSMTPGDEATSVLIGANAVLSFSETVVAGSGNILIKSGTTTVKTISVTDTSQVTFNGSTVTINPSSDLGYETAYSIVIASGVITDSAGNAYAGTSTYNFTTGAAPDTVAPTLSSMIPSDEATSVLIGANAVLSFSETVIAGSGNILIKSGNTTVQTISVTDTSQVTFSGSTVTINPSSDLGYGTAYSIVIASGVIRDSAGNAYAGTSTYNFTTVLNTVSGTDGDDTLEGTSGNDILSGGLGSDILIGGLGNDQLDGGEGSDTASYSTSTLGVTVSLALTTSQNTIGAGLDILSNIENLTGGSGNDKLTGNSSTNFLDGGLGVDTLTGGAGNDTYIVDLIAATGKVQDTIVETSTGGTLDTVQLRGSSTNAVAVTLTAGTGIEAINASATGSSKLNLTGNTSGNILTGNNADNILNGGTGIDTLSGGAGNDTYIVDTLTDTITEASNGGTDIVQSSVTFSLDSLAEIENLTLTGTSAINGTGNTKDNILTGNSANNTLSGGDGSDTLIGGLGNDSLTGGNGADHFVFNTTPNSTSNKDTITVFTPGTDVIDLSKAIFKGLGSTIGSLSSEAFYSGAGVIKSHDLDDRIIYNTTNGFLYYDADGTGNAAAIQIAVLLNPVDLGSSDFAIIG